MKKVLIVIMLACISGLLMPDGSEAGWLIYRKPEFKGKVIDAGTKEPVQGAVVVVMYYSSPILSGPGGGSPYIIHVKETLTDENGSFRIPAYMTLIQPNSVSHIADFIIYKPGYGRFPSSKVSPDVHFVDPEEYFSKPLGTKGEMQWESGSQSKAIPVTYGIVELPMLETKDERLGTIPGRPSELSPENIPLLYKAINEERQRFGLGPVGRVEP